MEIRYQAKSWVADPEIGETKITSIRNLPFYIERTAEDTMSR